MSKSNVLVRSLFFSLFFLSSLFAEEGSQSSDQEPVLEDTYIEDDIWYGPGFYYGVWFDEEDDYWLWRQDHLSYPANRGYYHPKNPIPYVPSDRDRGRSRREDGGHHHGGGGRGH